MIEELKANIDDEIAKLKSTMLKESNNPLLAEKQFVSNLRFLKWVNQNWKLRWTDPAKVVKQKEIFYCELGENIGSEQNGKRPVVIVQNNIGNSQGQTTIIVPITSYENSSFYSKDGKQCMSYVDKGGKTVERFLDFYEIPISITPGSRHNIHGIANVVHMREISKKRLSQVPVAKIDDSTYNRIKEAIIINIDEL